LSGKIITGSLTRVRVYVGSLFYI